MDNVKEHLKHLMENIFPDKLPEQNISSVFHDHNIEFSTKIVDGKWKGVIYHIDDSGKLIKYTLDTLYNTQQDCYMALMSYALTLV